MDFTSVAMNALKYAIGLFEKESLHVLHVTPMAGKTPEFIGGKQGQTKIEFLENELEAYIKHELNTDYEKAFINVQVLTGDPSEVIIDQVEANNYDAVLMGTRDKYNIIDKWLGTISLSLVKSLEIPIYLIPRFAKFSTYDQVVIASDSHLTDDTILEDIAEWNSKHQAFLNFLHIKRNHEDDFKKEREQIVSRYFEENIINFGFEINSLSGSNICKTILANAYNTQAKLIILIPENQSFLKSILINSISKDMILSSDIPMLFFNKNSESESPFEDSMNNLESRPS